jgi:hypothetical protein
MPEGNSYTKALLAGCELSVHNAHKLENSLETADWWESLLEEKVNEASKKKGRRTSLQEKINLTGANCPHGRATRDKV